LTISAINALNVKGRDPMVYAEVSKASTLLVAGTSGYILEPIRVRDMTVSMKDVQTGMVDAFVYAVSKATGKELPFQTAYHLCCLAETSIIREFTHMMPWLDDEGVFLDSYIMDTATNAVVVNISNVFVDNSTQYQGV
jgi:hypothetical protein